MGAAFLSKAAKPRAVLNSNFCKQSPALNNTAWGGAVNNQTQAAAIQKSSSERCTKSKRRPCVQSKSRRQAVAARAACRSSAGYDCSLSDDSEFCSQWDACVNLTFQAFELNFAFV